MISQLEIALQQGQKDPEGESIKKDAEEYLDIHPKSIETINILSIDSEQFSKELLERARNEIFTNPVTQDSSFDSLAYLKEGMAIWVGPRPGLMDPPGKTAEEAIQDLLGRKFGDDEGVYTSKLYLCEGVTFEQAETIARELLANKTVQQFKVYDKKTVTETIFPIPKVILTQQPVVNSFPITSDDELLKLSKERDLEINPNDIPIIRNYFSRKEVIEERAKFGLSDPTDVELEYIAQARSDHCNHNTFNGMFEYLDLDSGVITIVNNLFKKCIKDPTLKLKDIKPWILSVLWDNAGIGKFDENWNYVISAETHNSPSNIDPYGGAITGNVGEFRDKMGAGLGSKVFMGLYGFCVGPRDYNGPLQPKLPPRRLLDGIIKGVRDGGNKMGVPTPFGNIIFDEGYIGKCLVFVESNGIMPAKINGKVTHEKSIDEGDLCIIVGGRVGKDGMKGVTTASAEYSEDTSENHVQQGFPYLEKKVEGFGLAARDAGILKFVTDLGGGGNSSAIGESARFCGKKGGIDVNLDNDLLKYNPMHPWEIWVSESQERMLYVVSSDNLDELMELAKLWDVEARVLGTYKDHGKLHIESNGKTAAHIDLSLLTEDFPQWEFTAKWSSPEMRGLFEPVIKEPTEHEHLLEEMLSRPNICSKEWISRQYDHEVQGGSVIKPLVGEGEVHSDAVVSKPVLDSEKGFAITQVINPWFSVIDTYHMTANVIDEAVRRIIAVGGNPDHLGGLDNFCWPNIQYDPKTNPDGEYKAAQLVRSCLALKDMCEVYEIPLLSGKDSMYIDGNLKGEFGETQKVSAKPTLQFTVNSVIEDASKCVSLDSKVASDLVYILGETKDELGCSEYYSMLGHTGLNVPEVNPERNLRMYKALHQAIQEEIVASAHAVSRGGLGVHLAEVAIAGKLGMNIDLNLVPSSLERSDKILYSESAGRFIVTIDPRHRRRFEEIMEDFWPDCAYVGHVTDNDAFYVTSRTGETIIDVKVGELEKSYKKTFGDLI